jgi:hypothetical protein
VAPDDRDEAEALSEELAADAAATRARVASDVEALGAKLAPDNLKTQAKRAVTQGITRQLSRFGRATPIVVVAIGRVARRHPIPVALSMLALGVLVWRVRRA